MPPKKKITVPKAAVPVAVTNGSKKPNSSPNVTIGKAPLAGLGATPSPTPSPMESPVTGTSQQNSTTKRKREAMQKFYAVRFGKAPGVYLTWAECKSQVSGFTGALFKSFSTEQEAKDFVDGQDSAPSAKPGRFYAVAAGRRPGVHTTWAAVQESVNGFKGPKFRKFSTWAAAADYVRQHGNSDAVAALESQEEQMDVGDRPPKKTKEEQPVAQNDDEFVAVWTDGSCLANGKDGAKAGVGVYFGTNDDRNVSERLQGDVQTNQRAELTAILRALQAVPSSQSLLISTDSKYCIDCATDWYKSWERNGWKTKDGEPVKNQDLIKPIVKEVYETRLREGALTQFKWVKGHSVEHGNIQADILAVKGAKMS